ncbi:hypothetical protein Erwinia_phage_Fougasse_00066 [Erwinia phage Fougasse]|nr:hypothetical protein Erwinia_phage_Fougasse_00066 [Erwinia phage Fougasse]WJN64262.1 hypothetical protein Erwinia_phage_Nougat_00066 [Erwinia phage Nougat]
MINSESVEARFIETGDVVFLHGEWRLITRTWTDPRSPYNKVNSVLEGEDPKSIALSEKLNLSTKYYRRKRVQTSHVSFCAALDEMTVLKRAIEQYDEANNLPSKVQLSNTNFEIDSSIIQRECHERMMASINRLKNVLSGVKKP